MDLRGVLIPAATPFDPVTGDVDVVSFRANARAWLEHPVRGIVVGGSTGEAVLLDPDERRALLDAVRELIPDDRLLVAGTGAESTRATLALTREAADAGADAALVQPPAYYSGQMTGEALRQHYRAVADESPIPLILYQVPLRFATVELASGLVAELSVHENVLGMKDSRGDLARLGEILDAVGSDFQVLVGDGSRLYGALEVGAAGGILGVANLVPAEAARLHEAFVGGLSQEAGRVQERIGPLHREIVGRHGVPGVKAALDLLGMRGGAPRSPLLPLPPGARSRVEALLDGAGLLGGA